MTKANGAHYPVNRRVAALQERHTKYSLSREYVQKYKTSVPAYLALALPGHPPPLGPKWPIELPVPHPIRQGNLQLAQNN